MPAPIQTVPQFLISATPYGEQNPHVLALQNGQFDITWSQYRSATDFDARVIRRNADGSPGGSVFYATGPEDDQEHETSLASLGTVQAIAYVDADPNVDGSAIRLSFYSGNGIGSGLSDTSVLIASGLDEVRSPEVVALQGGELAIAWVNATTGQIVLKTYDPATRQLSAELAVNTTPTDQAGADFDLGMIAMSGGQFAISWRDNAGATHLRIVAPVPDLASADIVVEGSGGASDVIELADGRLAVIYVSADGIAMRTFDPWAHSSSDGSESSIVSAIGAPNDHIAATALLDGRLMVVWEFNQDILGRIMNADGTADSAVFNVTSTSDNEWIPHIATLADGRVVVTYDNGTDGRIYATIFDPREAGVSLNGTSGADDFIGSAFADTFVMGAGNDHVVGGAGDDFIDGGLGADEMAGGAGNDTYVLDNNQDVVDESLPGSDGTDLLRSIGTIDLSETMRFRGNIENIRLLGSSHVNGTGNALANDMIGNGGNNILNGRSGADRMEGGGGNDTYIVDNAGDQVIETAGGGTDTVKSWISWTLADNIERLQLLGTTQNHDATGNALNNDLFGNDGNNVLNGRAGVDRMQGFGGNDTYYVDVLGDQTIEAAGGGTADTVRAWISWTLGAHIERLQLLGTTQALNGTGNGLANVIIGNGGNNRISGLAGNDILTGGGGSDSFIFNTALNAATNVDTITDFSVADDTIRLDDAIFTAVGPLGTLAAAAFTIGAAATTAAHRIVYNSATGALIYDSNGSAAGGATQFAVLGTGLALTNADFVIA